MTLLFTKDITQLRANAATSILMISIYSIISRHIVTYLLLVFVASGIHLFSLLALPFYWLLRPGYSIRVHLSIVTLVLVYGLIGGGVTTHLIEYFSFFSDVPLLGYAYYKVYAYLNNPEREWIELNIGLGILILALVYYYAAFNFHRLTEYIKSSVGVLGYGIVGFVLFKDFSLLSYRFIEMFVTIYFILVISNLIKVAPLSLRPFIYLYGLAYAFFSFNIILNMPELSYDHILAYWISSIN
jgi:EpsG family